MPLIGNKCPGLNEYHTFESGYCLKECENQCIPASVLVHIQNRQRVDKHVGDYISVTSLLGCLRSLYGERTIDYFVEPRNSWWSIRGTLLHSILENPDFAAIIEDASKYIRRLFRMGLTDDKSIMVEWKDLQEKLFSFYEKLPKVNHIPNWVSETEYEWQIGYICEGCGSIFYGKQPEKCPLCGSSEVHPFYLRGTIDVLRPETGELIDYKTIGDRGLSVIKEGAKDDHIQQFNMYRLLVERGWPVGMREKYEPIQIKRIKAFYMTMMQVVGTGGLMEEKSIYQYKQPEPHANMVGEPEIIGRKEVLVTKKGRKKDSLNADDKELREKLQFRCVYNIPDVPLVDLDKIETFILERASVLVQAFKFGKVPPMCEPEMRAWKCDGYCPDAVREWCDKVNEETGEKRVVEVETGIPVEA